MRVRSTACSTVPHCLTLASHARCIRFSAHHWERRPFPQPWSQDCRAAVAAKVFVVAAPDGTRQALCERDCFRRLDLLCARAARGRVRRGVRPQVPRRSVRVLRLPARLQAARPLHHARLVAARCAGCETLSSSSISRSAGLRATSAGTPSATRSGRPGPPRRRPALRESTERCALKQPRHRNSGISPPFGLGVHHPH